MSSPPDSPLVFTHQPTSKSLFSESPLSSFASRSNTGHGGGDFSLSELSITDTPPPKTIRTTREPAASRFSLFGPTRFDSPKSGEDDDEGEGEGNESIGAVEEEKSAQSHALLAGEEESVEEKEGEGGPVTPKKEGMKVSQIESRSREEELQTTLFHMRKLNTVFMDQISALRAAEQHNRGLVRQVEQSHELLNMYTNLLTQTEHTTRLLLDPQWRGAEEDERQAEEQELFEAQERERLIREEQEEQERHERARIAREAQELREREEREKALASRGKPTGRVRGRGTTSSRVSSTLTSGRGRGISGIPTTSGIRRPTGTLRGSSVRARGRGVQ